MNMNDSKQSDSPADQRRNLIEIGLLSVAYFIAGKLGLSVAFVHPSSTAVWAPSGITLAAFLILGRRLWPGALLGAFLVNITTAGSLLTSLGVATGNTLEGLLGAYLVVRFANGHKCFERAQDTFKFAILACLLSTTAAATIGVTSLSLGGFADWAVFKPIWLTWWLGDAVGNAIVAPLLILWVANARLRWSWSRLSEFAALTISIMVVGQIVFGPPFLFPSARNMPLEYLCIPFLVWAAFRFGPREATVTTLVLSGVAIRGTLHGFGPFAVGTKNESLLLLQSFMGIVAVMSLALAVISAERRRGEEQVRSLAVTDPLTGLANYRRLVDVLDFEIKRFGRTKRPFAVLLLDLDKLKLINDEHGHLTGSRALCRVAAVLRVYCRDIDTAARYGGDEFALVIPEAGSEEAQQVLERIRELVGQDNESPAVSVSIGAAVYPDDGLTRDLLLESADQALYQMKRQTHQRMQSLRSGSDPLERP
jgi:diguanylate cyclase (GGDEF)-like protein